MIGETATRHALLSEAAQNLSQQPDIGTENFPAMLEAAQAAICNQVRDKSALVTQAKRKAENLRTELDHIDIGQDIRAAVVLDRGSKTASAGETPLSIAREFLLTHPHRTAGPLILGMVLAAAVDVGALIYVLYNGGKDALGHFQGSLFGLVAASLATIIIYVGIGFFIEQGKRIAAGALYALALAFMLLMGLWNVASPAIEDLYLSRMPGSVFSDNAAAVTAAPFLLVAAGCLVVAVVFSGAGWLFVWLKLRLSALLKERQQIARVENYTGLCAACSTAEETASRLDAELTDLIEHGEQDALSIVRQAVTLRQAAADRLAATRKAELNQQAAAAFGVLSDTTKSNADKQAAKIRLEALHPVNGNGKNGAALLAIMSVLAVPFAARGQSSTLQPVPGLVVLVDDSGSSPARDPAFIAAVSPLLEARVKALPVGASMLINTVGDSSRVPVVKRARVQLRRTADGDTAVNLARGLHGFLAGLPALIKGGSAYSGLIAGFFDAGNTLNGRGEIVMLSDMIENSTLGDCFAGSRSCRLSPPTFKLNGIAVTVYGCGLGLDAKSGMILNQRWAAWFKLAGVPQASLQRVPAAARP
jgi:hypothetical protein